MAKIMLVEDDNNLREIYEARLLAEGYEIVSAADGEEALAVAVKEKPDLIISDVMMPKISGFDMLDILRTTPETKDMKVIMMTALSQAEDKGRADKLGADRYLVKSQVTLEDVAKVAREVLGDDAPAATSATLAPAEPSAPAPVTPAPAPTPDPEPATTDTKASPTAVPITTPADDTPADPVISMPSAVPASDTPADTTTTTTAPIPPADMPPDGPVNAASAEASKVATEVNEILTIPDTTTPPPSAASTGHGKTLEPISDNTTPEELKTETDTPALQPGNVIQPGQGPGQISL